MALYGTAPDVILYVPRGAGSGVKELLRVFFRSLVSVEPIGAERFYLRGSFSTALSNFV